MEHPITSTLFRFVNYRNVELQTEAQLIPSTPRPTPDSMAGVFEDAISLMPPGKSKIQVLKKAAKDFPNPLKSVSDLKTLDQAMYDFSTWLVRNRTTYTDAELEVEMATVTQQLSATNLKIIWNNLFYQFITQESFYVKEALMQMILADHAFRLVNKDYANSSEYNNTVVNAKVALPGELFADYTKVFGEPDSPASVRKFIPTGNLKNQLNVTAAKATKKNTAVLRKEI